MHTCTCASSSHERQGKRRSRYRVQSILVILACLLPPLQNTLAEEQIPRTVFQKALEKMHEYDQFWISNLKEGQDRETGCRLWYELPVSVKFTYLTWTGKCVNGFAEGSGRIQFWQVQETERSPAGAPQRPDLLVGVLPISPDNGLIFKEGKLRPVDIDLEKFSFRLEECNIMRYILSFSRDDLKRVEATMVIESSGRITEAEPALSWVHYRLGVLGIWLGRFLCLARVDREGIQIVDGYFAARIITYDQRGRVWCTLKCDIYDYSDMSKTTGFLSQYSDEVARFNRQREEAYARELRKLSRQLALRKVKEAEMAYRKEIEPVVNKVKSEVESGSVIRNVADLICWNEMRALRHLVAEEVRLRFWPKSIGFEGGRLIAEMSIRTTKVAVPERPHDVWVHANDEWQSMIRSIPWCGEAYVHVICRMSPDEDISPEKWHIVRARTVKYEPESKFLLMDCSDSVAAE